MSHTPSPEDQEALKKYRESLEQEWKDTNVPNDPVAAAKKARAEMLGLVPAAIANLRAIMSSTDSDKLRLDAIKFVLSYTIGDKAKVAMPAGVANAGEVDEFTAIYSSLGAAPDDPNIPKPQN